MLPLVRQRHPHLLLVVRQPELLHLRGRMGVSLLREVAQGWEGCPQGLDLTRAVHKGRNPLWRDGADVAQCQHMTPEQQEARRRADVDAAIGRLTIADMVGLALRDHRRRLGLSQRAYAAIRERSPSVIARLETAAGRFQLDDVVEALKGTGFALALVRCADAQADEDCGTATLVDPASWPVTELIARVRDGSRRFPAHHETRAVINPPNWWWHREFFFGKGPEPEWYAPRPSHPPWHDPDDESERAGRDAEDDAAA